MSLRGEWVLPGEAVLEEAGDWVSQQKRRYGNDMPEKVLAVKRLCKSHEGKSEAHQCFLKIKRRR
jgi:hypothetical protein